MWSRWTTAWVMGVGLGVGAPFPIVLRHDVDHQESIRAAREYSGLVHLNLLTPLGYREGEATLIDERWLLTAAHVTGDLEPGHVVSVGSQEIPIEAVVRFPDWRPGPGGGPDLALVRLAESATEVEPVPLYRGDAEVGLEIVIVGLGDYGTGLTGPGENDGRVRLATNRVDEAGDRWIIFDFDPPESEEATRFEGVAGPGDSGGPAFAEIDGVVHLVGVSSGQSRGSAEGPGRYGVREHYVRVSRYLDWIEGVIGEDAGAAADNAHPDSLPRDALDAFGAQLAQEASTTMLAWHDGAVAGYSAMWMVHPVSGIGIAWARNYNRGELNLDLMTNELLERLLREQQ